MTGKQTFERGNNRNMAEKDSNLKLGEETNLLGGSSLYVGGGDVSAGSFLGGVIPYIPDSIPFLSSNKL